MCIRARVRMVVSVRACASVHMYVCACVRVHVCECACACMYVLHGVPIIHKRIVVCALLSVHSPGTFEGIDRKTLPRDKGGPGGGGKEGAEGGDSQNTKAAGAESRKT